MPSNTYKDVNNAKKYAPIIHQPNGNLNPICNPWPFARWRLNIIEPFPRATENRRFVLVAVNYFTNWVEAKDLANIQYVDVKKFIWKNIMTRFRVPKSLVSENRLQFDSKAFRKYYSNLGIKNRY